MNDRIAPGGGNPHDPAMETRMAAVETDVRDIKGILQRLEQMLGGITGQLQQVTGQLLQVTGQLQQVTGQLQQVDDRLRKVETEAIPRLAADVAELKGRVSQLPTNVVMISFVLAALAAGGLMRHFFP